MSPPTRPTRQSDRARRVILITGCSSGIGRACAIGLPRQQYRVFAACRKHEDAESLRSEGLDSLVLDLADTRSIEDALESLLTRTNGRLDGLVNNGAYGQPGAVEDLTREALRMQFETNLFGTHELTCACIPIFRSAGQGRIIQISSVLGRVSMANRGAYNASKHALESLSDTLRLELHGTGIHVSLIEPGPIESRFRANALKAFEENIDASASAHANTYRAVIARLSSERKAPFTLPASAVLKPLRHALESPNPRTRYPITIPGRVLPLVKRFVSDRTLDWILRSAGDRKNQSGGR